MGGGSEKKKAKKSVHRRSQESKEEFKGRKHVLESLHKPGIRLILHITVVLYCSLGSHSHLTLAPHIYKLVHGTTRGISYACILLVVIDKPQ